MALEPRDLGATTNVFPESSVRLVAEHNKGVKLASIAGDPILELGHPLMESATPGTYEPWTNTGGPNAIVAFVHPRRHQASSTGETLVVVMIEGDVHRDAVQLPAGETQMNLDAQLALSTTSAKFQVFGLEDVSL